MKHGQKDGVTPKKILIKMNLVKILTGFQLGKIIILKIYEIMFPYIILILLIFLYFKFKTQKIEKKLILKNI